MASYISPGAYARFVNAPTSVNNTSQGRTLAIVGTGTRFFTVTNEVVQRSSDSSSDLLANANVSEILSISSKPFVDADRLIGSIPFYETTISGGTTTTRDFKIIGGQYISWTVQTPAVAPKFTVPSGSNDFYAETTWVSGSNDALSVTDPTETSSIIIIKKDTHSDELTTNARYIIKISSTTASKYQVINEDTNQVLAELVADDAALETSGVIPGYKIKVKDFPAGVNNTDYVVLETYSSEPYRLAPAAKDPSRTESDAVNNSEKDSPEDGNLYYVSYVYEKSDSEYVPKLFSDYDDIVAEYGNYEITADGRTVVNSLSLAAEIAMSNNPSSIVCVQSKGETVTDFIDAIDKLSNPMYEVRNINAVVVLSNEIEVQEALKNYVEDSSSPQNAQEKIAFIGSDFSESLSNEDIIGAVTSKSTFFGSERVVLVVPSFAYKLVKNIFSGAFSEQKVPGQYLAVAVAALSLKLDPAEPLTNKEILGFTKLSKIFKDSDMNRMAAQGALILKQFGNSIRVRHGVTTSLESINSAEISVVQIRDYVLITTRNVLADTFIGSKMRSTIVSDVELSLVSLLNTMVSQSIILGYNGVTVKRSKNDPRQIDVKFEVEAVYPLNYIDITFSFTGVN